MSTGAAEILARIRDAGLTVAPDAADPGKVFVAPRERLTDELREMIRAHKRELLAALTETQSTPAAPAARELERRRAAVVARLEADPALRYSFDVQGASPTAPANGTVSVMLGLRTAGGSIVTGLLRIPGARWPGIALFNESLRAAAEARPS